MSCYICESNDDLKTDINPETMRPCFICANCRKLQEDVSNNFDDFVLHSGLDPTNLTKEEMVNAITEHLPVALEMIKREKNYE